MCAKSVMDVSVHDSYYTVNLRWQQNPYGSMNFKHKPTYVYHSLCSQLRMNTTHITYVPFAFSPTTNEQISYTIHVPFASPNSKWTMFINISYTIRFPPTMITTISDHPYLTNNNIHIHVHMYIYAYVLIEQQISCDSCSIIMEPICAQGTYEISYRET